MRNHPTSDRTSRIGRGLGRSVAVLAGILLVAMPAAATNGGAIELMPMAGWQWGGTLDYYDPYTGASGDVHIEAAESFGGAIVRSVGHGVWGELSYWYQGSEVTARPSRAPNFKLFDLSTHYVQLSGLRTLSDPEAPARPFVIGGLGLVIADPGSSDYGKFDSSWNFALSGGGGLMLRMGERVTLRAQCRLLLPISATSGSLWFGTGGAGVAVSARTIPQGDAVVGLSFPLGR